MAHIPVRAPTDLCCALIVTRLVSLQPRWRRRRVHRDDASGGRQRGAGRPPDTQELGRHRDRSAVRPEPAAGHRQRHVERDVRDRVPAGQRGAPMGRVHVLRARRLVAVVQRHPVPVPDGRSVRRPGPRRAPGQYRLMIV